MGKKTILFEDHVKLGGKIVDFAGWDMPLHYGSQINEHLKVRNDAGIFDVSHMVITDISGDDAKKYLRYLLANDVNKILPGKALYSCMLNANGGIIDDLIVYQLRENYYRLVTNAATHNKVSLWLTNKGKNFKIDIQERHDLAIIAIQGPHALVKIQSILTDDRARGITDLKPFSFVFIDSWLLAYTGYTGEIGLEIILPITEAKKLWQALIALGIQPCGLGARDTLRLEAGLNLYGLDMDESTTPLESNLGWTVAWKPQDRFFIGRDALVNQKREGIKYQLIGLIMEERAVLRSHQAVFLNNDKAGEITSGSFSPTLQCSIAFARVPLINISDNVMTTVLIRDKQWPVKIVKPPFVRHGKKSLNYRGFKV